MIHLLTYVTSRSVRIDKSEPCCQGAGDLSIPRERKRSIRDQRDSLRSVSDWQIRTMLPRGGGFVNPQRA
ncbi:hypothetical protein QUF80_22640 [Desulfococcaceae bacterium HSG8]|nr:hypothetical protein [Desulfococcaceae bacterium HSG8]